MQAASSSLPLLIAALVVGIVALVWGANRFVDGADAGARSLGVPPIVVGLTVVAFATSAPELLVSSVAAFSGSPDIGIGNALGSNIANMGLVLGLTAAVRPVGLPERLLRQELPLLALAMVVTFFLLQDSRLGRLDGILLLSGLVGFAVLTVRNALRARPANHAAELAANPAANGTASAALQLVVGLVVLLLSSRALVWAAASLARFMGIPELVIGLTVIAVGTSLPELAASVACALRGQPEMAVGNIVGSNLFNLLGVLGLPGVIMPQAIDSAVIERDFAAMVALTLLAVTLAYSGSVKRISRLGGLLLLLAYGAYGVWLFAPP